MLVRDILHQRSTAFSLEFFPPKDDQGRQRLFQTISELRPLKPAYVSVTYGAGGTTRERTLQMVEQLQNEGAWPVVSHLTCVGSGREELVEILDQFARCGVVNILALRGDPPRGEVDRREQPADGFAQATELVAFIKKEYPAIGVGVAGFPEGHPQTPNRLKEIDYLKAKVDAGADYIVTQLFFDNRDFYDFRERCELAGITVPIVAGIMPITSRQSLARMADLAAGSRFPAPLLRALARTADEAQAERVGIHWAAEQVRDLLDNQTRGIHFYTLNSSRAVLKIYETLGAADSRQLAG